MNYGIDSANMIDVDRIFLDQENPRHEPHEDQDAVIEYLCKEEQILPIAMAVMQLKHPWIVTYDNVPEIQKLYRNRRQFVFDINYTVQTKRIGTELLIASKGLRLTPEIKARQTHRVQYRAA